MHDRTILYTASFLRALATGLIGVHLGFYLAALRFEAGAIGLVVTLGLAGATAATVGVTWGADRVGHRRLLAGLAAVAGLGGVALAVSTHPAVVGAAAFLGMVNGMGRDRGAALVLEQAVLPATGSDDRRTFNFAVYHLCQDFGHALGALLAGVPAMLASTGAPATLVSPRTPVFFYALLMLVPLFLYPRLSPAVEPIAASPGLRVSPGSRRFLAKLSGLFALDALGSGFLTTTLLAYFFHVRFGVSAAAVGPLFFGARIANALSHLAAAWLARRIGLVNTMVFTHIPSSLLLLTVAVAPSFPVAAALFLLREALVEMDVPTRQSYVMAIVRPEERTVASGVTHLVRLGAWAVAPVFAGAAMQRFALLAPLAVGAAMKISYDLLLYFSFRKVRPPEEERAQNAGTVDVGPP